MFRNATIFARLIICLALGACISHPARAQAPAGRKILKQVEAQYPAMLKKRGIGGTVRLRVTVKPDGSVRNTEVLGGSAILATAAQTAVMQWKFAPGSADTTVDVSIVFDPNS